MEETKTETYGPVPPPASTPPISSGVDASAVMAAVVDASVVRDVAPSALFDTIRSSCRAAVERSTRVSISADGVKAFVASLDMAKFKEMAGRDVPLPLSYTDDDERINFQFCLHLCNFGSGYRHMLHEKLGRGAFMTMIGGVMSLYLGGFDFSASAMATLEFGRVVEAFSLDVMEEVEIMPAVYESKRTDLHALATLIKDVINDAGKALRRLGYAHFAELLRDTLAKSDGSAAAVLKVLATEFVGYRDVHVIDADAPPVFLLKKAQITLAEIVRRVDGVDAFPDYGSFTAFVDNVLPAVLRKSGVIVVDEALAKCIDSREHLPAGKLEIELRAAALVACEDIVAAAAAAAAAAEAGGDADGVDSFTAVDLDYYLWELGKQGDWRKFERHATRDSMFY